MTNDSAVIPNAGVRFPPPFIYLAGVAVGWALNAWHPLPIATTHAALRLLVGAIVIVVWLASVLSTFGAFRRHHTTIVPNRPATTIVTDGLYRFTRNPMYVGLVVLYLGLTLLIDSWWPLLFLPVVLIVIQRFVIEREERYLRSAFPADYEAYASKVRRWL